MGFKKTKKISKTVFNAESNPFPERAKMYLK